MGGGGEANNRIASVHALKQIFSLDCTPAMASSGCCRRKTPNRRGILALARAHKLPYNVEARA
jgi:hypothetical protein